MAINKDTSSPNSATRSAVLSFARQIVAQPAGAQVLLGDKDARLFATEFMRLYNEKVDLNEVEIPGPDKYERRELALNLAISSAGKDDLLLEYVRKMFLFEKILSCDYDAALLKAIEEQDHYMNAVIKAG